MTEDQRLDFLQKTIDEMKKENKDLEERVRELEKMQGRISERMTMFQLAQAGFTTIATVLSNMLGNGT